MTTSEAHWDFFAQAHWDFFAQAHWDFFAQAHWDFFEQNAKDTSRMFPIGALPHRESTQR
jgi:hypothetical protein